MVDWMDQGIAAIQQHDPAYGAGDTILGLGSHMLHGAARGIGGLITLGATGSRTTKLLLGFLSTMFKVV